jgi:hypothetical protein
VLDHSLFDRSLPRLRVLEIRDSLADTLAGKGAAQLAALYQG